MTLADRQNSFYEGYFARNQTGKEVPPSVKDIKIVEGLCEFKKEWGTLLDIGCLNSPLMYELRKKVIIKKYYGIDLIPEITGQSQVMDGVYRQVNIDQGIPDLGVDFEVVVCSEVIEHVFSPDNIFRFSRDHLTKDGLLVITTPNLGVWYNRLLLLAGYQPCFTEVSDQFNTLGKMWTDSLNVGGHLRLFTWRALRDIGERYGFRVRKVCAVNGHGNLLASITHWVGCVRPSLGRTLICFFERNPSYAG